jgi:hypothetical protein
MCRTVGYWTCDLWCGMLLPGRAQNILIKVLMKEFAQCRLENLEYLLAKVNSFSSVVFTIIEHYAKAVGTFVDADAIVVL